ncbi:MAG TPA: ATP-binding protein [archaeon]|jgi:DNA helicase HerA-like ATPase|nr:ATP-binding protein [archaeon]HPV66159.1 ATP-binding protein [archaeon]
MTTKEEKGIVISTIDGPSTTKLSFVCTKNDVFKGEYIQIDYSQGSLIGLVTDVIKRNRYFENSDSVKDFENNNVDIKKLFPSDEWEFLEAVVKPLGVYSVLKGFTRTNLPVSPGQKVYLADPVVLSKFLHFDKSGVFLGAIEHPNLDVALNVDRLLQKHLAILAQSGAGKSYLTSVIIEELLERTKEQGRIAVVLFDTHGEYSSFAQSTTDKTKTDYSSKVTLIDSKDVKIGCTGLSAGFYSTLIPELTAPQKIRLSKVITKLNEDKKHGAGPYSLQTIIKEIDNLEEDDKTAKNLRDRLLDLERYRLFDKIDYPSINDVVSPGKLTIIDLSREIDKKKKQIILYYFANKLFRARMEHNSVPPFTLVVEEAHQYAPEMASRENALAKNILETIAREGRKFGASVWLISQRPVKLSTTILSQANTHIILRITNPYDLKHIGESSEGLDQNSINMITSLRVGEALIVGEASSYPVFFKVRKRKSQESHLDVSLSGLAKSFEARKEKNNKELDELI